MEYITSKDNAKIKNFIKLVSDKKYRKQTELFVCEGEKVLNEAISWGIKIDTLIMSEDFSGKHCENYEELNATVITVPRHLFEKISDTKSPQGVVFSCPMITKNEENFLKNAKKVIILDNLQDPGNMGTIIRTGAAFGIDAIILLNNCVDHYAPKVVRSTMNAIFSIPVISMSVSDCFEQINLPIYATYLDEHSQNIGEVDMHQCAVIIGNESKGVSEEVANYADKKIIIPIKSVESLNASVAASIVMWEMAKNT
ncbi:MAG: RNA methyltransferase [Clostridia bacterium]